MGGVGEPAPGLLGALPRKSDVRTAETDSNCPKLGYLVAAELKIYT